MVALRDLATSRTAGSTVGPVDMKGGTTASIFATPTGGARDLPGRLPVTSVSDGNRGVGTDTASSMLEEMRWATGPGAHAAEDIRTAEMAVD